MDKSGCDQELPGFRFHPTEEELLNFYLKNMVFGKKLLGDIIGFLNIYNHDPRELPGLAKIGEREWYFFVPRDKKHGSGGRPNRTTENGFWKATGSDRQILSTSEPKVLGLKKTLVFYEGRAPRGTKTDWIMNEYRLPDKCSPPKDIVLCKVYRKATSLKMLEHKAAMEEDIKIYTSPSAPTDSISFGNQSERIYAEDYNMGLYNDNKVKCGETCPSPPPTDSILFCSQSDRIYFENYNMGLYNDSKVKCGEFVHEGSTKGKLACSSLLLPSGIQNLGELQLPKYHSDWTQDSFWTQFSPFLPMC